MRGRDGGRGQGFGGREGERTLTLGTRTVGQAEDDEGVFACGAVGNHRRSVHEQLGRGEHAGSTTSRWPARRPHQDRPRQGRGAAGRNPLLSRRSVSAHLCFLQTGRRFCFLRIRLRSAMHHSGSDPRKRQLERFLLREDSGAAAVQLHQPPPASAVQAVDGGSEAENTMNCELGIWRAG